MSRPRRLLFRNRAEGIFISAATATLLLVAGMGMFGSFAPYVGSLFVDDA